LAASLDETGDIISAIKIVNDALILANDGDAAMHVIGLIFIAFFLLIYFFILSFFIKMFGFPDRMG
jgi:hypothetical protein